MFASSCLALWAQNGLEANESTSNDKMQQLIAEIKLDVKATANSTGVTALSPEVIDALFNVKRHQFVDTAYLRYSYQNRPLPISDGQTISQPFIVAIMTEFLQLTGSEKVLEVGTGSGYQAAVLSLLSKQVHSIEIIESLAISARSRLKQLGYENVIVHHGDGYKGIEKQAPFDAIMVTAAPEHVPALLVEQLKNGGRMIIPVGKQDHVQMLTLITKNSEGRVSYKEVLPVSFVPLTRD
ncbi:MAG: protein-L-isoaspartate(D-aspartate) O-methyltransferase [Kangiellaceae bacterium]|nr:protein-L-isoaspartate(D-aspartate) O-methyltransferase [Kangiellaceae bacterium]